MPDTALFAAAANGQLVTADGIADPGAADAGGQQGAGHGGRFHRRLAGRQRARLAAQGPDASTRCGTRISRARWRPRSAASATSTILGTGLLGDLLTGTEVVGQPGAGRRLRGRRRHRHDAQGGHVRHHPARRDAHAGGLPGRDRREPTARRPCAAGTRSAPACSAARSPIRPPTCRRRSRRRRG